MTEPVRGPDSPYVGLAPFETEHADYFFGRSLDSSVLADNVLARPITVLYGASGVGKSSVLNVGLPRALTELGVTARIAARSKWYEPGELAAWLDEAANPASMTPAQPIVVILDQFEEHFLYADADQIKGFARSLAKFLTRTDLETHLLFALRDDGLHRLDALRLDLPTLLDTTLELRHLDESSVREAIELPITAWNERHSPPVALDTGFAASLVAQLCPKNLEGQPIKDGRIELAYLQLALEKIWEAEGGASATALRTSTLTERLKGVSEIARRHVEEVLGELKEEDQAVCATVFDRLVTPSGGKIAYATADLAAVAKVPPDRMDAVLSPLASGKSRILRAVTMPGRRHTRGYEILHDILARPILDWREQRATDVERKRADTEALARRQVEQDRQRLARMRAYLLGLVAVLAIATGVAVWAGLRARRAEEAARASEATARASSVRAQALRLTAEGQFLLSNANDERGLLELIAAARMVRANEIDSALLSALLARRDMLRLINTGHGRVEKVVLTPDGRIVSGGSDGTLRLWDAQTGQPIGAPFQGHRGRVESVAVTPDGRRLVSGGEDGTLRLWDAQTGQPIGAPLTGHQGHVQSVAVTPDGRRLVSGGRDGTLRLWDAQTGQAIGAPLTRQTANLQVFGKPDSNPFAKFSRDLKNWVQTVAVTPDGRRLVSGGNDGMLRLWDAQTGQPIGAPLAGHRSLVLSIAITSDGRLVSGGGDGTLRLWDAQTGRPIGAPIIGHRGGVLSVAVTPDGRRLVSGGRDGTLRLWDAQTGRPIGAPLAGHQSSVGSVAVSPDSSRLISGGQDGTLRLWEAQTGQPIGAPLAGHQSWVSSVAVTPDSRRLVSGHDDGTLRLWDPQTGQPIGAPLTGHRGPVLSVAVTPDGRRLVSGGRDATLRLWNAQTRQPIGAPLTGHQDGVQDVAVTADGRRLVSGGNDGTLRLWDAQTGQPIGAPLTGHQGVVLSVAVTPDGRFLVSGGNYGTLRLWNAQTGRPIGTLTGHDGTVMSVAVTPDGRQLVSGGVDDTLRLWDAQTGQPIGAPLTGHQGTVESVAVTPDGRRLVSGGEDGTLRLWEAQTGQPIGPPLTGHQGRVRSVAVTPDGRRLVSGGEDGALRIWPAPDAWPDELCSKLMRNMTAKEWREWVSPDIEYVKQCPDLPIPADTPEAAPTSRQP